MIYRIILGFYIIKHLIFKIKSGKLIIRNSPVDYLGTITRYCFNVSKGIAGFSVSSGFVYALCHELDDILDKEGKNPYFIPGIKNVLDKTGINDKLVNIANKLGVKDKIVNDEDIFNNMDSIQKETFTKETGVSIEQAKEVLKYLKENNGNKTLGSEVKDLIETKDPFNTKKS
jgi:hypothetical protein